MTPPCRLLDWDSAFFQKRIGRLEPLAPQPEQFDEAMAWCGRESVDCLYFQCHADDSVSTRLAEDKGFHLVDMRVEMEKPFSSRKQNADPGPAPSPSPVRPFRSEDLPALKAGARENHGHTRFFRDPGFPRERAGDFYALWLEQICADRETAVFTAENDGLPVGYITCKMESGSGRIALAGVNAGQRGRGLGTALVLRALEWFSARQARGAFLATQGANVPAQRLYASHGFYVTRVQLWYHKWFR